MNDNSPSYTPKEQNADTLKIAALPMRQGSAWWANAYRLFRAYPTRWFCVGLVFWLLTNLSALLLQAVVSFGGSLVSVLVPCFIAGFTSCAWSQTRGAEPSIKQLFNGFKANVRSLIALGIISMLATVAWLYLIQWALGLSSDSLGAIFKLTQQTLEYPPPEMPREIYLFLTLLLLGVSVIAILQWFATMVIVFLNQRAMRAITLAARALLKNTPAFFWWGLLPALGGAVFILVLAMLSLILGGLFGEGGARGILALAEVGFVGVFLLVLLVLSPLSFFVAYCDIFHAEERVFESPASGKTIVKNTSND